MRNVIVLGAGKIGSLITCLLADSGDYQVHLVDIDAVALQSVQSILTNHPIQTLQLNLGDFETLDRYIEKNQFNSIVSCLPFYCNVAIAQIAVRQKLHYFDLTEDIEVTESIKKISQNAESAFVPQCGLAPGFISIAANHLINQFDSIDIVKMRVGALPLNPNNVLKYSLTWSTDGLINEYGNPCYGIEEGKKIVLLPLEGYETITLDGVKYEAFNTSGGLGNLADTYENKVRIMTYKTIRYPGHCEKIKLLMQDLKLNHDRKTLKTILENAIPKTKQDVVLIYVSVTGLQDDQLFEKNYAKKIYPKVIVNNKWSAIQISTAAGICGVIDIIINHPDQYKGFIPMESISLHEFLNNRFGQYYDKS